MPTVEIDATSFGRFAARLRKRQLELKEKGMKEVGLKQLANQVRTNAIKMILQSEPTGEPYRRRNPGGGYRTGVASAPGEPPHQDTGELAKGIQIRELPDGYAVVSSAYYSSWLEYGTKLMAARPFLYPALAQALPDLQGIIRQAWQVKRKDLGT